MSSGSYFPPPVKAVEIPKAGGKGVRVLGCAHDRGSGRANGGQDVSGTESRTGVSSGLLRLSAEEVRVGCGRGMPEALLEGGLGRSIWTSRRSSTASRGISSSRPWNITPTNVGSCCMCGGGYGRRYSNGMARWCGGIAELRKVRRFPRCWLTCSCITRSMRGWLGSSRTFRSSATVMTRWCIAAAKRQARQVRDAIAARLVQVGLGLHPDKTRIVYCKDEDRRGRS